MGASNCCGCVSGLEVRINTKGVAMMPAGFGAIGGGQGSSVAPDLSTSATSGDIKSQDMFSFGGLNVNQPNNMMWIALVVFMVIAAVILWRFL